MNADDFRIGVFHGNEDIGPAFPDGDRLCHVRSRRVKKLKLRKGGSFPTFLVLDGCCTTSLPWTLE
jgi:hypothetical protein